MILGILPTSEIAVVGAKVVIASAVVEIVVVVDSEMEVVVSGTVVEISISGGRVGPIHGVPEHRNLLPVQ